MKKGIKYLIPLIIIALAVAGFAYMKATKPEQPPVEVKEKVWKIEYVKANFDTLAPMQRLYGQVESNATVSMSAPIAGVVGTIAVKEGQVVKKGEPIVALTEADLQIPLQKAQADYDEAVAQLQLEKLAYRANVEKLAHEQRILSFKQADVTRAEQLLKKDLTSTQALEQSREALAKQEYVVVNSQLLVEEHKLKSEQNRARVEKTQSALSQAKLNVERGNVVAPYTGRVAKVHVAAGDVVQASKVMVEFYGFEALELRAKLPVRDFLQLDQRMQDGETVLAEYVAANGVLSSLKLSRLAGQASASGVDLLFELPAELNSLRPGDLLEISLLGASMQDVVALPYSALYGNDRVYVIEDERLKAARVKLLGDLQMDGELWALVKPEFANGAKINVTHLPNAVSGLKVSGAER